MGGVGVSLSSVGDVLTRIGTARQVAFGTYFLGPGRVRDALIDAARRGAVVSVTMQDVPYRDDGSRAASTRASARALRAAGANVTLLPSTSAPFHLKAAVCDGVAFLDDRNWSRDDRETVLEDADPADVALVRDALGGRGSANPALATRKDAALAREIALIDGAREVPVIVETETLGASALSAALRRHARSGAATTLVVGRGEADDPRERALLRSLREAGVAVRRGGVDEKLALAGDTAWIGSANGTATFSGTGSQIDWGVVTTDTTIVHAVRAALTRDAAL